MAYSSAYGLAQHSSAFGLAHIITVALASAVIDVSSMQFHNISEFTKYQ